MNVLSFLFKVFVLNQLSQALITGNLENNWYNRLPKNSRPCLQTENLNSCPTCLNFK